MKYKIAFKSSVSKDLKKLDNSVVAEILEKIETKLSKEADHYPTLKGKFAGLRKFRVGDYRVIYTIMNNETVLILRVAHRKDVYKK